jgi:hypothetical protein
VGKLAVTLREAAGQNRTLEGLQSVSMAPMMLNAGVPYDVNDQAGPVGFAAGTIMRTETDVAR